MRHAAARFRKILAVVRNARYRHALIRHRILPSVDLTPLLFGAFTTVLDVGANRGQFALVARESWPRARIISFEPGPRAATAFANTFRSDSLVELHSFALGAAEEQRLLTIPPEDDGASFLVDLQGEDHLVGVKRLDDLELDLSGSVLLKMDVQGFEMEVLRGAKATLGAVDSIIAECTFRPVAPIPSAAQLIEFLAEAGFTLTGALAGGSYGDLRFDRLPI